MKINQYIDEFEVSIIEGTSAHNLKFTFKEWKKEHKGAYIYDIETSSHGESSRQNLVMTIAYVLNANFARRKPE